MISLLGGRSVVEVDGKGEEPLPRQSIFVVFSAQIFEGFVGRRMRRPEGDPMAEDRDVEGSSKRTRGRWMRWMRWVKAERRGNLRVDSHVTPTFQQQKRALVWTSTCSGSSHNRYSVGERLYNSYVM